MAFPLSSFGSAASSFLPRGFDPLTMAIGGGLKLLGGLMDDSPEPQRRRRFTLPPEAGGGSIANNIARWLNNNLVAEFERAKERRANPGQFMSKIQIPETGAAAGALDPIMVGNSRLASQRGQRDRKGVKSFSRVAALTAIGEMLKNGRLS